MHVSATIAVTVNKSYHCCVFMLHVLLCVIVFALNM